MAFVTLAQVKDYLGIPSTDTQYDTFLTQEINVTCDSIEGYCGRIFSKGTYIQTFYREEFPHEYPVRDVFLYHFPLIGSITKIVEKCSDSDPGIPVIDYRYHTPSAKLTKNYNGWAFFTYGMILEVEYTANFEDGQVPSPVLAVVYGIIQEKYNKKKSGVDINFGSDVQRISIAGAISIDYDYSLSANDRKTAYGKILGDYGNVLDNYRSERAVMGNVRPAYVS